MILFVESYNEERGELVCRMVKPPKSYAISVGTRCLIDFMDDNQRHLVGYVIKLPDDTQVHQPVFLPDANILIRLLKGGA